MQHCEACGIDIRGKKDSCPLCHGPVVGLGSESAFPVVGRATFSRVTKSRILSMIAILFLIVMGSLATFTNYHHPWMILAVATAVGLWIDLEVTFYYQHNILKMLTVQTYIGIGLSLLIDWLTGYRGWSVTWVIPFAWIGLAIATLAIALGLRLRIEEYIVYLIFDAALSLIQLLFLYLRMEIFRLPLLLSMAFMVLTAVLFSVLRRRELKVAMEKVFHA